MAVLTNATAVSYALLEPGSTAHPISGELKDVQQVFVVNSGTGVIKSGDKTFELSKGKAFIITPSLDFKMTGTGDHYMTFYVVTQKLPAGLTSKSTLEVVDNSAKPQVTNAWYDKERALITTGDGLGDYHAITHVELPSMEMARPYSDAQGVEEIWIATDGDVDMLFGKELRKLPAGTAYRVPSTGKTAHANINMTANPAQFLYMVSGNAEASAGH
jgi:mannose-6-phosphate isomerase-like protein (cupin superfamily)